LYENTRKHFPPGLTTFQAKTPSGTVTNWYGNPVHAYLLPYLEQQAIYDMWDWSETMLAATKNTRHPANIYEISKDSASAKLVPTFLCPSNVTQDGEPIQLDYAVKGYATGWFGQTSYVANGGSYSTYFRDPDMDHDGMFFMTGEDSQPEDYQEKLRDREPPAKFSSVIDGTSYTLLFGERFHYDPVFDRKLWQHSTQFSRYPIRNWSAWSWTGGGNGTTHLFASTRSPINYMTPEHEVPSYTAVNLRMSAFGSAHPGGANFVFTDGSVQFLTDSINMAVFRALGTKQGREPLEEDYL
jgi:prepilin-type processing-associated H-X9-DG protein